MKGASRMFKALLGSIFLLVFTLTVNAATQTWTKLAPTGGQPQFSNYGVSTVYDLANNRLILFGGRAAPALNDVWVLTNADGAGVPQWTMLSPTGSPPTARNNHTAVYDAVNNRMIIFGGCMAGCTPILNDVWVLSNANGLGGTPAWTQLSTAGSPAGRNNHKAAYDPVTNRMIVFGGQDGGGSLSTVFEDVWVLTNANGLEAGTPTWSLLSPSGAPASGTIGYYIGNMAYDSAANRMTVFGGLPKSPPANSMEKNDVWVLNNANGLGGTPTWTNTVAQGSAGSPPNQTGGAFVSDAAKNIVSFYNFIIGTPSVPRTWTLSHANGLNGASVWSEIFPGGGSPGSPHLNASAYNTANGRMMVYTNSATQANTNEMWVLASGTAPYSSDANTVLLDHFDGTTGASILGYSESGAACGSAKPSATPNSAYVTGSSGLSQALSMNPPVGQPVGSATYLQYPGGQLLSQANGTIEFWTYLTTYGTGVSLVDQGPQYGSCAGWTFGMGVNAAGQLNAGAWAAFNMNSGSNTVPLNTWTHLAATWGSNGAKLYINGVQVGSDVNTGMPASGYGGSVLIHAGSHTGAGGHIDELRISNVQRTSFAASGGAGTGTHNASGSYTWNSTTGAATINWTSSDFICEGPNLGAETKTGVAVTATTMVWPSDMTWTRASGTANDIVGTWTSTDSTTGNSYTATFNANGTGSLVGVIVQCGGGGQNQNQDQDQNPHAQAQHWSNGYSVQLQYNDSPKTATAVSVTGPGISGSKSLTYNTGNGQWDTWTAPSSAVDFGTSLPTGLPYTYTFTITPATGTPTTATSTVSCFQAPFVTNISPAGSVTGNPTFSWTGISDTSAVYGVQVNDSNGNWLWANYNIPGTSIDYNGPALAAGVTYGYVVSVQSSSTCSDGNSFVAGSFTYGSGGTDITAPTVPTGVSAVAVGSNQVNVSWDISTDNLGVTYYRVYRNGSAAGTPVGATNNFWPDNSVVPNTTYSYTVAACDAANNCSAPSSTALATTSSSAAALNLTASWNLIGNSINAPMDVAATWGDTTKVTSVWKWMPATSKWAFYAPSMAPPDLAAYAATKGYDVLTTINGGEGFWVNAKAALTAQLPAGTSIGASHFQAQLDPAQNKLVTGWNLIATGDNITPSAFNKALSVTPPAQGVIPLNITTLWAWDSALSNWYFYAPSLENSGGLINYITTKGYLDFGARTLDPAKGFWVNHP